MVSPNELFDVDGNPLTINRASLADIERAISEIAALNLSTSSVDDVLALIRKLGAGYAYQNLTIPAGRLIYRAIPYFDKPTYLKQLSYPPQEYAKLNRASLAGESLFYGTFHYATGLREIHAELGTRFVISRWKIQRDLTVTSVGFTDEAFELMRALRKNTINALGDIIYTNQEENVAVHNFLAAKFTQDVPSDQQELYKLTIAIARFLHDPKTQGMIYPSIAARANAENIILRPEVVDEEAIRFDRVIYAEVSGITEDYRHFGLHGRDSANSIYPNGQIAWSGLIRGVDGEKPSKLKIK